MCRGLIVSCLVLATGLEYEIINKARIASAPLGSGKSWAGAI
jgi:hypothetical protein